MSKLTSVSEFKVLPPHAGEAILLGGQATQGLVKWGLQILLVLLSYLYENGCDHDLDHGHGHDCVHVYDRGHQTDVWVEKGFVFALSVL